MRLRCALAAAFLSAATVHLAALETIGKITYLDGRVELVRDGAALDASIVHEGLDLANFDLLKTGTDGQVELRISSPAAPAATITVSPRTQFSVEIGTVASRKQTTIDLVAGSVALKCAKLTGSQSFRVQTEGAAAGVRGTDFTVDALATGDLLVTCDEGEVECTDEKGGVVVAAAGEAIERLYGKPLVRVAAAAAGALRRDWTRERTALWQRAPLVSLRIQADLFNRRLRRFNQQFVKAWRSKNEIYEAWRQGDRTGALGRLLSVWKAKADSRRDLRALGADLFLLECTYVRLLEMKQYCLEKGISGNIGFLRSTRSLFARLDRERQRFELRRALVRWIRHQYALGSNGEIP